MNRRLFSLLFLCNLSSFLSLGVAPLRCSYLSETDCKYTIFFIIIHFIEKKKFFFHWITFFIIFAPFILFNNFNRKQMESNIIFIKEQKKPEHPNYKKTCQYCGREFECVRYDTKFCTPLCRVLSHKKSSIGKSMKANKVDELKKTTPKEEFKKFDFVAALGGSPIDENWQTFRQYLLEQFGWTKPSTLSYKGVKKLSENWNKTHKKQITISRTLVDDPNSRHGKISRIIFFVN